MKDNFPKGLTFDMPIDEEKEFLKIKSIFEKHQALNRTKLISYETMIQEDIINEMIFKKMIRKEYVRKKKDKYYYDIRMENVQYRRHIRNLRIMIYGSILIYAIFVVMFVKELL